nr:hypothetical protein [Paenibacillus dendritiformis]
MRFHGIFYEEMMVCDEDEAGGPRFHFRFVDQLFGFADQLFDFILSGGLKPFVELGLHAFLAGGPLRASRCSTRQAASVPRNRSTTGAFSWDRFRRHGLNP